MTKKQRLQIAIDALALLAENDEFIAAKVIELQAHADSLPDENTAADEGEETGGSNPPPGKTRG